MCPRKQAFQQRRYKSLFVKVHCSDRFAFYEGLNTVSVGFSRSLRKNTWRSVGLGKTVQRIDFEAPRWPYKGYLKK